MKINFSMQAWLAHLAAPLGASVRVAVAAAAAQWHRLRPWAAPYLPAVRAKSADRRLSRK